MTEEISDFVADIFLGMRGSDDPEEHRAIRVTQAATVARFMIQAHIDGNKEAIDNHGAVLKRILDELDEDGIDLGDWKVVYQDGILQIERG